jgi:hypothetical protein
MGLFINDIPVPDEPKALLAKDKTTAVSDKALPARTHRRDAACR